MSALEKAKQAIAVAEKYGFKSIISIEGSQFGHMPAGIHLSDKSELEHLNYQIEGDAVHREMFVMLDDVKVYVVLQPHEYRDLTSKGQGI